MLNQEDMAVLNYIRDYTAKNPEIGPYIVQVVSAGIEDAIRQERAIRADMETIACMMVEKRFGDKYQFVKDKLEKWRGKLCVNWDWFIGEKQSEEKQDG